MPTVTVSLSAAALAPLPPSLREEGCWTSTLPRGPSTCPLGGLAHPPGSTLPAARSSLVFLERWPLVNSKPPTQMTRKLPSCKQKISLPLPT